MARKGLRKLVDIGGRGERLTKALERFLGAHGIAFELHHFDGFVRYYVRVGDLRCAQAVLPALVEMAAGREEQ